MKSALDSKWIKLTKLTSLCILICLTVNQIKTLSKNIDKNQKKLLVIQTYNLKLQKKINQRYNPTYVIESIKNLTQTSYIKTTKPLYNHYQFKTPITTPLIKKLINLISVYNNSHTELSINIIKNTVDLIIPRSQ
jgi:hypothetical protein